MPDESDAVDVAARRRLPALVQGALVAAVLVTVAAVSLTARQPPPPAVAEYAPQAVAQIQQAPPEQAVDLGRGREVTTTTTSVVGGGSQAQGAGGSTSTSTSRPFIDKPRVRRCVGEPPGRQIEDPQSPPCVPYFDPKESNGGATSRGVTAGQINVSYTLDFFENEPLLLAFQDFFNSRFEFYGRSLVLKKEVAYTGDADPAQMQKDAQDAYDNNEAFAVLNYTARGGAEYSFYDAAAEKGMISVSHRVQAQATDAHFRRYAPYEWSSVPTVDSMLRNYGQFVCASLAHRAPRYAGGRQAGAAARRFGLIVQEAADGSRPDTKPLEDELARCDTRIEARAVDHVTSANGRTGTAVVNVMAENDVTSVICLCESKETRETLMPAASAQVFQPEWLMGTYLDSDLDNSMDQAPPDQAGHVLGLAFRNKLLAKQDMPFYWALKSMNAANEPEGGTYYSVQARYSSLLVLASGIQMAGPHLTPSSFAAGLLRTRWTNPGAGGPPYWQARAGFDGGRRTFIDDAMMFWYDPNRRSTVDPDDTGAVCYVNHGERHGLGQWPPGDPPFFTGPCL